MMIYCLGKYPEIYEEIEKEINDANIKWEELSLNDLKKFEKLEFFMKETLRMYSPAPSTIPRIVL